jgi:hypothetical protein
VFIHACREQQQRGADAATSSSSGSWAPAEAQNLLLQLAFPIDTVDHYTAVVCKAMPETDPLMEHLKAALTRLQQAMSIRLIAMRQPDGRWAQRYASGIAAAAAAAGTRRRADISPAMIAIQHITAPPFHPAQMVYLGLEYVCVVGLGSDKLVPDLAGLSFMSRLLTFTQGQAEEGLSAVEVNSVVSPLLF